MRQHLTIWVTLRKKNGLKTDCSYFLMKWSVQPLGSCWCFRNSTLNIPLFTSCWQYSISIKINLLHDLSKIIRIKSDFMEIQVALSIRGSRISKRVVSQNLQSQTPLVSRVKCFLRVVKEIYNHEKTVNGSEIQSVILVLWRFIYFIWNVCYRHVSDFQSTMVVGSSIILLYNLFPWFTFPGPILP